VDDRASNSALRFLRVCSFVKYHLKVFDNRLRMIRYGPAALTQIIGGTLRDTENLFV
jgi:hypothetical protein